MLNIDVLAIIPQYKLAIIIEDKIYTSEHSDQIKSYTERLQDIFNNTNSGNAYHKLEKAFRLLGVDIKVAELANYHIHTVYFKTGYYFDYDWQVAHSEYVHNYLTGPMLWDILKNYNDCESDVLKSYCDHLKQQLDWCQSVSKINGKYDDGGYYIKWERITQHGLLQIIFDNENTDGSWLWKDMSAYPNEYSTGTNQGGRPWSNRRFWSRTESKAIRSNPPTSFKPWLFWRVDYDSKGPYLSLRYYREASNESDEIIRKNIYDKLSDIIYSTIGNEKDELKRLYKNCISQVHYGKHKENRLIHITILSVLDSWDINQGQSFIDLIRRIDNKLREVIKEFDWENF